MSYARPEGSKPTFREHVEPLLCPGDEHLVADPALPSHDRDAAALLTRRTLGFLAGVSADGIREATRPGF